MGNEVRQSFILCGLFTLWRLQRVVCEGEIQFFFFATLRLFTLVFFFLFLIKINYYNSTKVRLGIDFQFSATSFDMVVNFGVKTNNTQI